MAKRTTPRPRRRDTSDSSELPEDVVRVRMYCQGLGDCFLLTFPHASGRGPFHVLIDCGVILGTPHAKERMREVVQDIVKTTRGSGQRGKIDLLIGTHEHWDHVSGFHDARDIFNDQLEITQTWLAWTEDPHNTLAKKLRSEREAKQKRVALALWHFQQQSLSGQAVDQAQWSQLSGLASFLGVDGASAPSAAGMGNTAQAMQFLREQNATFLTPGKKPPRVDLPSDVEIFVLGPPPDEKLLKKDLPTKGGHETYEFALAGIGSPDDASDESQVFDDRYGMPLSAAISDPYYVQTYDNGLPDHPFAWRRIDDIGLYAATDLALQLDSDTNNTSLALAFRLPNGKVLLFPGDAQVGNWESWQMLKMHDGKTTMQDLFANTVLYKVGHHGSHNATLSTHGLEQMISPDLMAMLPVDEDVAHNKKGWLRMPFDPLMAQLKTKTQGRILRVDHERPHPATDSARSAKKTWTASPQRFTTAPTRSLYLETLVPLD